jgi:hypothetical protein
MVIPHLEKLPTEWGRAWAFAADFVDHTKLG